VIGQKPAAVKFGHRVYTSGTAGTAPSFDPLLKGCFMTSAVVASTSVTYSKSRFTTVALSIGVGVLSEDGTVEYRIAMSGAKGTFDWKAGKLLDPLIATYSFDGAYQAVTTYTPISGITFADEMTYGTLFGPFAETPTGLFAFQADTFEFNRGVKVSMRTNDTASNGLGVAMLDADDPQIKLGYRLIPKSTSDELAKWVAGTAFANSVQFGSTTGSIVLLSTNAYAQYSGFGYKAIGPAQGVEATLDLNETPTSSSEDAFSIVFK
jgi:hypothetical protein